MNQNFTKMKKLLLVSNIFLVLFIAAYCHTKTKSSGSATTNSSNKDAVKSTTNTAVIHGSANQAQLDSIKKAKTKEKNK